HAVVVLQQNGYSFIRILEQVCHIHKSAPWVLALLRRSAQMTPAGGCTREFLHPHSIAQGGVSGEMKKTSAYAESDQREENTGKAQGTTIEEKRRAVPTELPGVRRAPLDGQWCCRLFAASPTTSRRS